ncbi:hypothetical protein LEMLEM_LOCUS4655, partial [Lemmus lemmus]
MGSEIREVISLAQNHTAISGQFGFLLVVWRLRQIAQVGGDSHFSSVPGDPSRSSMPRSLVQGQNLDCHTALQRLEARPMEMSAATLYGKMAGLNLVLFPDWLIPVPLP